MIDRSPLSFTYKLQIIFQILIAECAEPRLRGFLIGVPFVFYAFGILLTYSLGVYQNWRTVAWCCNILPIASIIALYFAPESPVSLPLYMIDRFNTEKLEESNFLQSSSFSKGLASKEGIVESSRESIELAKMQ